MRLVLALAASRLAAPSCGTSAGRLAACGVLRVSWCHRVLPSVRRVEAGDVPAAVARAHGALDQLPRLLHAEARSVPPAEQRRHVLLAVAIVNTQHDTMGA